MAANMLAGGQQQIAAESGKGMSMGMKGAGGEDEGGMTELYKLNRVYYRMLPTLSLVSKRTLLVTSPNKTNYAGTNETITFILNTGEYYVACCSSYLHFQIGYNQVTGANNPVVAGGSTMNAKALIAQGNAMQLFEEVVFTTASGTEVCREQNKGLNAAFKFRYTNTQEYIDTIGQVQGAGMGKYSRIHDGVGPIYAYPQLGNIQFGLNAAFPLYGTEGLVLPRSGPEAADEFDASLVNINRYTRLVTAANGQDADQSLLAVQPQLLSFVIPLDQVLGLFKPYLNTLMPAGLLAGGRLDMRLKNPIEALQYIAPAIPGSVAAPVAGNIALSNLINIANSPSYLFQSSYLVMDAYQMQDNVLKRLNAVAGGTDGLTVLFDTYDHTVGSFSGSGQFELMVSQARSRVIRSWVVVRDYANLGNPYVNSLAAEGAINRSSGKTSTPGQFASTANRLIPITNNGTENQTGYGGGLTYYMVINAALGSANPSDQIRFAPLTLQPYLPGNTGNGNDNVLGLPLNQPVVSSYQAVLGSLYFPQQPLTTSREYYENALYIMCKGVPDKDCTCSVSLNDFLGGLGEGTYTNRGANPTVVNPTSSTAYGTWVAPYGLAIYGMLAEKSEALQLSGLPLSNARLLRHIFRFAQATISGAARTFSCFTEFTRIAKVFLGGRTVVRE